MKENSLVLTTMLRRLGDMFRDSFKYEEYIYDLIGHCHDYVELDKDLTKNTIFNVCNYLNEKAFDNLFNNPYNILILITKISKDNEELVGSEPPFWDSRAEEKIKDIEDMGREYELGKFKDEGKKYIEEEDLGIKELMNIAYGKLNKIDGNIINMFNIIYIESNDYLGTLFEVIVAKAIDDIFEIAEQYRSTEYTNNEKADAMLGLLICYYFIDYYVGRTTNGFSSNDKGYATNWSQKLDFREMQNYLSEDYYEYGANLLEKYKDTIAEFADSMDMYTEDVLYDVDSLIYYMRKLGKHLTDEPHGTVFSEGNHTSDFFDNYNKEYREMIEESIENDITEMSYPNSTNKPLYISLSMFYEVFEMIYL